MRHLIRDALLGSVAIPAPWAGEFSWWHTVDGLRALGMRWSEIERVVMSGRPVRWDADAP